MVDLAGWGRRSVQHVSEQEGRTVLQAKNIPLDTDPADFREVIIGSKSCIPRIRVATILNTEPETRNPKILNPEF